MAANDYIVVAPNRRGMQVGEPNGTKIFQRLGRTTNRDYLAAADFAKTLPFVDGDRMAAVGASYGGFSVFMLAGVHENRFKTFIAHDGLFDMKSWLEHRRVVVCQLGFRFAWEKPFTKSLYRLQLNQFC